MIHRYPENLTVLLTGILIAAIGVIPIMSGNIFRNGAPTLVAGFLIIKGASKLRCKLSDVMFSIAALIFIVLSKVVPAQAVFFHIAVLALLPIFAVTGLTLKNIALNRTSKDA